MYWLYGIIVSKRCQGDTMKKPTTIRLDEKDRTAIEEIKEYYGVESDIDAIRIALRELQRQLHTHSTPTPNKERPSSP
jgi:hypothetical protein